MSIVCANSWGWMLDSRAHIDEGFQHCVSDGAGHTNPTHFTCHFNQKYFQILNPHVQSQQNGDRSTTGVLGGAERSCSNDDSKIDLHTRRKRKRKQHELNSGEIEAKAYHDKIRCLVVEGCKELVDSGRRSGFLSRPWPAVTSDPTPEVQCGLAALCEMAKQLPLPEEAESPPIQRLGRDAPDTSLDVFSCLTENPSDCALEATLLTQRFLLPPRSRFLLSDITRMNPLVNSGEKFDLIVLDPPWENKSVKRSNRYSSLPSSQLKRLPVPALSAPGCLLAIWVTNRAQHQRFVREELYPHWGVEVLAEWIWVKVTCSGEFVFPLDSQHKKPYEVLVLGRKGCSEKPPVVDELPDERLLVSVPSLLHSQKPSLAAVLKPYLVSNPRCLELFARSLHCDWTSWGNEVIKYQHTSYFTKEITEDPSPTNLTARQL